MTSDFFKYLTPGDDDKRWGLYLTVAGRGIVRPNEVYPNPEHPSGYFFTWEKGRILNEYQLVYITKGSGVFECEKGQFPLKKGSVVLLRPGLWHRYKPTMETGWNEQYVGFNGKIAHHFLKYPLFSGNNPIIDIGIREDILSSCFKIYDLITHEKPGFQKIASGMLVELLGYIISFENQKEFSGKKIETIIEEVRYSIRNEVEKNLDWEKIAVEYNVGYSYFRKMFRKYTGMSPHQYHLELKILRAKELLVSTDKSVKEICFETGFHSEHYFSRLFKEKTGFNPSDYRMP